VIVCGCWTEFHWFHPTNSLNKPCHYLANLATMVLDPFAIFGVLTICSENTHLFLTD
jgi:hypothetical protein